MSLGIPPGPVYARLKRGEVVELPDGRRVDGRELTEPPQPGKVAVLLGDTELCEAAVNLARGADVLVHEATFLARHRDLAKRSLHSTALDAAVTARKAGAKALILTHVSPRYQGAGEDVLREARALFPNTRLAEDHDRICL